MDEEKHAFSTDCECDHQRWNDPRFAGGKFYLAKWREIGSGRVRVSRRKFRRASDAEVYAAEAMARYAGYLKACHV